MAQTQCENLLDLPEELLGHIAEHCDTATDIFALRSTCRKLAGAAFLPFTETYIADLTCFILDPSRLQRIINIISTPHLKEKIRTLCLTTNSHENRHMTLLAPNINEQEQEARNNAYQQYATDQYDTYQCQTNGIRTTSWALIQRIIEELAHHPRISVEVDVNAEESVLQRLAATRPHLLSELLDLGLAARVRIHGLALCSDYPIDIEDFSDSGRFRNALTSLEKFEYASTPANLIELQDARQHHELVKRVLRTSEKLKQLYLGIEPWVPHFTGPHLLLSKSLLIGSPLASLRDVELVDLDCWRETILGFLRRCKDTLEQLSLRWIVICDEADPWVDIFKALTELPQLKLLHIYNLSLLRDSDNSAFKLEFIVPGGEPEGQVTCASSFVGAKTFLEANLKKGLTYKTWAR